MTKKMNAIEKLIAELCPEGVEWKALGNCASIKRGNRVTKSELSPEKRYPVYSGGVTPMGYFEKDNQPANTITVVKYGTAGFVNFIMEDFWANDVCYCIKPSDKLNNKYLFFILKSKQDFIQSQATNAIPAHLPAEAIAKIQIPIPPLAIQQEIVKILDTFTTLEAELEAELEARKKQYEYYRDELLTFGEDVEWKTLGEVAEIGTGSSNTNEETEDGLYPFFVRSQIVRFKNTFEFDETAIITSGDGVGVGKIFHYIEGKYALHQRAYRIHVIDRRVNPKFYFFYMRNTFEKYILSSAVNSSVTSVRRPMLNKYPIPIPPLTEQERIVAILDKFDTLVNDISVGLPAELNARRKQYEYYRNKLLTFEPLEEDHAKQ